MRRGFAIIDNNLVTTGVDSVGFKVPWDFLETIKFYIAVPWSWDRYGLFQNTFT